MKSTNLPTIEDPSQDADRAQQAPAPQSADATGAVQVAADDCPKCGAAEQWGLPPAVSIAAGIPA